jgi:rhodanese-related sulfurtransferase
MDHPGRTTIAQVLAAARSRIHRYTPVDAKAAATNGAVLVDVRDSGDRQLEGTIPGALWVPRSLLEWRADPTAETPDPRIADPVRTLIVFCNDGYSSSLAAASLRDIGFEHAGDLVGGFRRWRDEGHPTAAAGE